MKIVPPGQFPEGTSIVTNTAFLDTDQMPTVSDDYEISVSEPAQGGGPPVVGGVAGLVDGSPAGQSAGGPERGFALILGAVLAFGIVVAAVQVGSRRIR